LKIRLPLAFCFFRRPKLDWWLLYAFSWPVASTAAVLAAFLFATSSVALASSKDADPGAPKTSTKTQPERRIEELFIWKVSEELKLPPAQELKFTEVIRSLGVRKRNATEAMAEVTRKLDAAKDKSEAERSLKKYHEALREFQAVQLAEYDNLKGLLGAEKLARYLVVKSELNEKLKTLLSNPTSTAATPPPKATPPGAATPLSTPSFFEEK
jgi:hypothetical protein